MKKLMVFLLSIMLMILIPANVLAQGESDIASGDITIDQSGTYSIDGKGQETSNNITINENLGKVELTIKDLIINSYNGPAIKVNSGSTLKLIVEGDNHLTGASNYAAISVAPKFTDGKYDKENSAKIIISGSGDLKVIGGSSSTNQKGAGAGIGGDGYIDNDNGGSMGEVIIDGANITAKGGESNNIQVGAGAGIGTGGSIENIDYENWGYYGRITINSGNVIAVSGKGYLSSLGSLKFYTNGAAAIGNGGSPSNAPIVKNDVIIEINDGNIIAKACEKFGEAYSTGAAIGSGAYNVVNSIIINGGKIKAYGGCDENGSSYCGAAIGSSENTAVESIHIGGDAEVYAYALGGAAAIGSGNVGTVGNIEIVGNAKIVAIGGTQAPAIGNGMHYGTNEGRTFITLNTTNDIIAFGGKDSHVIGDGKDSWYNAISSSVTVGKDSGNIYMFNTGTTASSITGINIDNTIDEDLKVTFEGDHALYYHNDNESSLQSLDSGEEKMFYYDGEKITDDLHTWSIEENTITISSENEILHTFEYDDHNTSRDIKDNWAVIMKDKDNNGSQDEPSDPDTPTPTDPDDNKPSSKPSKPSSESKPQKVCDVNDLNCDGVITCEELLGKYWNWDEASKSCIYTKQVEDSIIVNTSTK